jgi:hypothetical protein
MKQKEGVSREKKIPKKVRKQEVMMMRMKEVKKRKRMTERMKRQKMKMIGPMIVLSSMVQMPLTKFLAHKLCQPTFPE